MSHQSETRHAGGAAGLENSSLLAGSDGSDNAPNLQIAQSKTELIREKLAEKWPAEYADGVAIGLGEKPEGPREPGGYLKGFHAWPLERRNAWWSGANMGVVLFSRLQDGDADE